MKIFYVGQFAGLDADEPGLFGSIQLSPFVIPSHVNPHVIAR